MDEIGLLQEGQFLHLVQHLTVFAGGVAWTDVWRYAINSVLHDLRERWRLVGLPPVMSANYQV